MSDQVLALLVFWFSLSSAFVGDVLAVMAARRQLPVVPAIVVATILFGSGGIEALFIYRGMHLLTVAWLWPAMMQIGHTAAAVFYFHETATRRELLGSAIVFAGVVVAGWPGK